jgi:Tol biopolymer transport system component
MYLANGDILLSGPEVFDPKAAELARRQSYLSILGRDGKNPPVPLGVLCSEGPAISRQKLQIAWTEWRNPGPGEGDLAFSKIYLADIDYPGGKPVLANRTLLLDGSEPGYRCTMETQNFNPVRPNELIFNTYTDRGQKCDVLGVNLETKKIIRYTSSPAIYDEAEGAFPDGEHTLVECDIQRPGGPANIDLWKLSLDSSGRQTRLTHFSDYPGYKASNGVVSDDGKFMAFQMGRAGDAPGIGHGVFLLDLGKVPADPR